MRGQIIPVAKKRHFPGHCSLRRHADARNRLQLPHIVNRPRIGFRAALAAQAQSQIDADNHFADGD